jgi:hypothetical protein
VIRRPTIMRNVLAVAVLVTSVACGRSSTPGAGSGIFGVVTAGPTCPVERVGSPCPPGLWTGDVRATDASGHAFDARTDDQGNYSLSLAPGSYVVIPVTDGGPPTGKPTPIVVVTGPSQRVDLTVDTGIR